jgi:hypothetical protein
MRAATGILLATMLAAAGARAQTLFGAAIGLDDGRRVVPIARFVSSRWAPVPREGLPQPAPEWVRYQADGRTARIRVAPAQRPGGCPAPQVLRVTPERSSGSDVEAGLALAVMGQAHTTPLARLDPRSPSAAAATAAATSAFERRAAGTGVASSTLARVATTIDALYAAGTGTDSVYYFEASKRVPDAGNTPDEDPKGIVRVAVSGWLRHDGGRIAPAGTRAELHWEPDEAGRPDTAVASLTPLGVVHQRQEAVWVMADTMGTRRQVTLYALGDAGVRTLLTSDVSGC